MQRKSYTKDDLKMVLQKLARPSPLCSISVEQEPSVVLVEEKASYDEALHQEDMNQEILQEIAQELIQQEVEPRHKGFQELAASETVERLCEEPILEKSEASLLPTNLLTRIEPKVETKDAARSDVARAEEPVTARIETRIETKVEPKVEAKIQPKIPQEIPRERAPLKTRREEELEEKLASFERTKSLLVQQLQEQSLRASDCDRLKQENEHHKTTIKDQSYTLSQLRAQMQNHVQTSTSAVSHEVVEELKQHHTRLQTSLEAQLAEQKQKIMRFMCDRKELDDKLALLTQEKTTLAARLRELSQKNHLRDDANQTLQLKCQSLSETAQTAHATLTKLQAAYDELAGQHSATCLQKDELTKRLEHTQEALHKSLQASASLQESSQEKIKQLTDELHQVRKSYEQQLAVSQACLVEKQQSFDEEQKRHRLLAKEYEDRKQQMHELQLHAQNLEQHLARRIKECAVFAKQLQELQNSCSQHEQKIASFASSLKQAAEKEQQKEELVASLNRSLQEQAEQYEALNASWLRQEEELIALRKLKDRLMQLEKLLSQCDAIFSH